MIFHADTVDDAIAEVTSFLLHEAVIIFSRAKALSPIENLMDKAHLRGVAHAVNRLAFRIDAAAVLPLKVQQVEGLVDARS
jgi:hypothetical protein